MTYDLRETIIALSYVVATLCFIFGLKRLSSPATARSGNQLAAVGMFFALAATLLDRQITSYWTIIGGTIVGAAIGIVWARRVQMTAMPQMVALFNGMGGATAALVSVAEYVHASRAGEASGGAALSVALGTAIGAVSFTGSLVAFGKLQEILPGRPIQFPLQKLINALVTLAIVALAVVMVTGHATGTTVWLLFAAALVLGLMFVLPIGGGDMPVVISVLNSLTGLAAALTGIVLSNQVLMIAGVLVGASGTLLTLLMSRAMNRSLANVLFGGFGAAPAAGAAKGPAVAQSVRQTTPEDAAVALSYAAHVVIVPGYGMAVAEAQHSMRELEKELEKRGVDVRYAIHPVAGRMPGHLNVILSEAGVDYDALLSDIDAANAALANADVAFVVGANDIVNPAAEEDPSSPLYGMPILQAYKAKTVFVVKRGKGTGFAGVDNPLFYRPNTQMLYGDAKAVAKGLIESVRAMEGAAHF